MPAPTWEFWIDVGGTFTDCLAKAPDGAISRHKLLSSGITKGSIASGSRGNSVVDPLRRDDPTGFWVGFHITLRNHAGEVFHESVVKEFDAATGRLILTNSPELSADAGGSYELHCSLEAPVVGIRYLLGLPLAEEVAPVRLRLGTTRGTNALLTRSGAKTALVTTRGFGDLLDIGYQDRPELFALTIKKPSPLVSTSIEIEERVAADGTVLCAPSREVVLRQLEELQDQGIEALAICLLHADLFPAHEQLIEEVAREVGFGEISRSSAVAPLVKIVSRAETTVVDAYLNPVLREYVARLGDSLPGSHIRLMTSAGGLVDTANFCGHQSVLSGPAGGVVGYARAAEAAGFARAIGFDMGGTSTDVSRFDGHFDYEFEARKAGVRLVTPMLAIHTVAAGGGSICRFDGAKLTVGPESAGADPGPACYGRGGPLAVTDLNLYLGRIATGRFPFELDRRAVEERLQALAEEVQAATGERLAPATLAEGLLEVANASMTRAIRGITVAKGFDPSEYVLVAFGGAAAQHACAVARELGVRQVLNHPDSGILSAYGIGQADVVRHSAVGIYELLENVTSEQLEECFSSLGKQPHEAVVAEGFLPDQIDVRCTLDLRYQGTEVPLNVEYTPPEADLLDAFEAQHRQQYGYTHLDCPLELVAARLEVIGKTPNSDDHSVKVPTRTISPEESTTVCFDGKEVRVPLLQREDLRPGDEYLGAALIADSHSSIVIEPGWQFQVLSGGELLLTDRGTEEKSTSATTTHEAVQLELFNHSFMGIAEQMGHVLRRTALSVNVKERLDYSCAVFTANGELVANAPHVPVHLGAMGATVRSVIEDNPQMFPGDVFVSNDPYRGGSHLPDVTVVTPVHHPESGELLFFTACRAHHAEIGGVRPGSMPPNSRSLADEGILISNFALVRDGKSHEAELREFLAGGHYPSRRIEENLADLRAQVAANQQGARELLQLVERNTLAVVQHNMQGIQQAAESAVRKALQPFGSDSRKFVDFLETIEGESVPIQVQITFHPQQDGPAAVIDFTGSSPHVSGNLNANPAIVSAAVLYVLRLLVEEDIPLNEGALRAVEIVLPPGLLNPPPGTTSAECPAVAAGNVETSQRVVDVLLGAFGVAGASQGTMNNLLFGDNEFGYYETICGGSGATEEGPGADAVQVHMTNTRATDPEILERRHPVRLWEFSIRKNSGGEGKHRGGNGVVRRIEFLAPLEVSLITGRRGQHPPYGMAGGLPGAAGKNFLVLDNGTAKELAGICEFNAKAGEQLIIETPGGGGFGEPE